MKKPLTLELIHEWNEKLRDSGFTDIETSNGHLKKFDSIHFFDTCNKRNMHPIQIEAKLEYHLRASQFLTIYEFISDIEKEIWMMHADGKSVRVIALSVRHKDPGANKDKISGIIRRIRTDFKKFVLNPEESYEEDRPYYDSGFKAVR